MIKRYLLRPSRIVSQHDGDIHFIGAAQLARLHGVDLQECVVIEPGEVMPRGYTQEQLAKLEMLTPAYRGNYGENRNN